MLSPADYAAYSRQTGRAYPQSEEEKAEMYGEVREFRENQLKAPSTLQTAGGIALGAGALAGIGAAAMKLRGRARDPRMQSGASAGKSGVQRVDLSNEAEVRRIANLNTAKQDLGGSRPRRIAENEVTSDFTQLQKSLGEANAIESKYQQRQMPGAFPAPEKAENTGLGEFQRFSQQADDISAEAKRRQSVYQDVAAKPEPELPEVSRPQGGVEESMLVTDPNTGEVYRRGGGRSMRAEELRDETVAKVTSQEPQTLVDVQDATEPLVVEQNLEASNTASDQAAAPIERELQRNEDVDVGMAQRFLNNKREKLEGQGLSPTRIERVLASDPATAEAAELYASTGDEAVLSRFSEQPASPVTVKAKSASRLEEIPTKELYRKAPFGEFVDDLEDKDIELTNRISSLGVEQQELAGRRKELEEGSLMIKSAMDREAADQDAYSRMYGQMQYEMQNMPDPASLNVDIGDAMAERENVRSQIKGLKEVGPQQFLADVTEGLRIGYEVDPSTEKIVPGTEKTRSYLKPIEQTKAGGGRRVAEFTAGQREPDVVRKVMNPKSGYQQDNAPVFVRDYDEAGNQRTAFEGDRTVQAKKTVYGLQTPDEVISEGLRPSRIPESSVVEEGLRQSVAAPEGDVPIPPPQEVLFVREKPQRSQDPLKASEAIRRARIEGDRRDPQALLRAMGFGV